MRDTAIQSNDFAVTVGVGEFDIHESTALQEKSA
jgi:hypothetical protein